MVDFFSSLPTLRILVYGDVMLDRYIQGSASRISPEAPVPVVRRQRSWSSPGGAGHVAACLAGLGCQTTVAGLIGDDAAGDELASLLRSAGVAGSGLRRSKQGATVAKTRILAGDFHQMLRLDEECEPAAWARDAEELAEAAASTLAGFDAVVLTDYEKGALTAGVVRTLIDCGRRAEKPIVVDPKKADLTVYRGATVITPNCLEAERAVGSRIGDVDADAAAAATELRANCQSQTLLITRGPQGMTGVDDDGVFHIPARTREVADVTGAGDTVVAVLAAALASGLGVRDGCELAAHAAGIAVSHPGTYVVRADELRSAAGGAPAKVLTLEAAVRAVQRERERGRSIVFTNGCFDLLHPGHLYSLQKARAEGHYLVVGLNSDRSIRALKGPTRPVLPEDQRATLLSGLACVDAVVLFEDQTPERLIQAIEPDVLVKGGDYTPEGVVGGDLVRRRGGRVVVVPRIEGLSTTELLTRIGGGL
jgi:D-beta-D-heptose 7-phosphate kinase/D-beta-D-heptose 1-phosphate adenosyltransferase